MKLKDNTPGQNSWTLGDYKVTIRLPSRQPSPPPGLARTLKNPRKPCKEILRCHDFFWSDPLSALMKPDGFNHTGVGKPFAMRLVRNLGLRLRCFGACFHQHKPMKPPVALIPLAALAACCLLVTACKEQHASTALPFLGSTQTVHYTYRYVPKSQNLTGNGKAAIVVVAELPFLKGNLEAMLRQEGLPPSTRTSKNSYSQFRGLDVHDGKATGSFLIRNQQFGPAFGTPLSDVTVAVNLVLTPVVDRRGELAFQVKTSHRKVSGSGLAAFVDDWSGGRLINLQHEIDKAFRAAQRLMPQQIEAGFSGQDVAPTTGPIRKLTLVKARFVTTLTSPVAMEFVFNPG